MTSSLYGILRTALLVLGLTCAWSVSAADHVAPTDAVRLAIERYGQLLLPSQVDLQECEAVDGNPTFVVADVNGDGRKDAAALVASDISSKPMVWNGKELRSAKLALILLLDNGRGGYTAKVLETFPGHIPAAATLTVEPAGATIQPLPSRRKTRLQNAAIVLTFCGKSAAAYSIVGSRVHVYPLSD